MKETGVWNQQEADQGHVFSYRLAKFIAELLNKQTLVYDMGCGKGAYVKYLEDMRFVNVCGVEGEKLADFESKNILVRDLAKTMVQGNLGNVICLEVAEHIPAEFQDIFMSNICKHVAPGHRLILSWAVPGQDGFGHVYCQSNIWVIERMKELGFVFHYPETAQARHVIERHCDWFKNTLLIFHKNHE